MNSEAATPIYMGVDYKKIKNEFTNNLGVSDYFENTEMYHTILLGKNYQYVNSIVKKVRGLLECTTSRECFVLQKTLDDNLPVHIDINDHTEDDVHKNYYSIIFPLTGLATTTFFDCDENFNTTQEKYNYVYSNDELTKKMSYNFKKNAYLLDISQPHSVIMKAAPRLTYHIKLNNVEFTPTQIKNILERATF